MGPPGVPRVPISGPNRGIFSNLNGPGPLGSGGHSHTSFSNGRFRVAQRTLQYDVEVDLLLVNLIRQKVVLFEQIKIYKKFPSEDR